MTDADLPQTSTAPATDADDVRPPDDGQLDDGPTGDVIVAEDERGRSKARTVIEWVVVIAGAVALALVIKTFLFQAFYIPSQSMVPTLEVGDRVIVNKLSYHLHDINRGDIVVFERPPGDTGTDGIEDLIKRVIGLPGDSLVIKDGHVYVNGQLLEEPYLPDGTVTSTQVSPNKCTDAEPCVIPDHSVWVMGDNRTQSRDSRWFGAINEDLVVGRAFIRVWPLNRIGVL